MSNFTHGFLWGVTFFGFLFLVMFAFNKMLNSNNNSTAMLNIYWQTDKGNQYKATTILDNGQIVMDGGVYITAFELSYTVPALTTKIRRQP